MPQRGVVVRDLAHALANATECVLVERGRWRVDGPDLAGDDVTAIVVIEDGVVVVTVF